MSNCINSFEVPFHFFQTRPQFTKVISQKGIITFPFNHPFYIYNVFILSQYLLYTNYVANMHIIMLYYIYTCNIPEVEQILLHIECINTIRMLPDVEMVAALIISECRPPSQPPFFLIFFHQLNLSLQLHGALERLQHPYVYLYNPL